MTLSCAIFDLDGTLSDCEPRRHHVSDGRQNWKEFHAGIGDDLPNTPIVDLCRMMYGNGITILLSTGRSSNFRTVTELWLTFNQVPYHELFMRNIGDERPDHIVKIEMLDTMRVLGYNPTLAIDDRNSVVAAWRQARLTCLQCADGNF